MFATWYLSIEWLPLGAHNSEFVNFLFVAGIVAVILVALMSMVHFYEKILRWALQNKWKFLMIPAFTLFFGLLVWQGFDKIFGFIPKVLKKLDGKVSGKQLYGRVQLKHFPEQARNLCHRLMKVHFC